MARTSGRTGGGVLLDSDPGTTVANTALETSLLVAPLSIPAAKIGAGDLLRFSAGGTLLNNTGGTVNFLWRLYLGATLVLATSAIGHGAGADLRRWYLHGDLWLPTLNTQRLGAVLLYSYANSINWMEGNANYEGYGTAAENLAVDSTFNLTIQPGAASANAGCTCYQAHIARVPAP